MFPAPLGGPDVLPGSFSGFRESCVAIVGFGCIVMAVTGRRDNRSPFMYVCVYVCMYVCMYVLCMYICMCVCMYVCIVYVCMYVRTYVCMYVCMCAFFYIYN